MGILFECLLLLLRLIHALVYPIFLYIAKGKKKVVPPITNDLLRISATDLAEKIRKKEISSEQICNAYIQRIQEVNPIINAVVEDRFEEAIKEARNVDEYLTKCSLNEEELRLTKPLLGVPLTVKESCSVKGLKLTAGMLDLIDQRCEADGETVSRLKSAGAIVLLVSNTPELCLFVESVNYVTGTTNNPYDTTCSSAGSSGGEGALCGAGASVIGIGSDIAGSIRLPAAFNGVFGHKPTSRITSLKGHYPSSTDDAYLEFAVIGPITRYAKDMRLMMNIMVEPHHKQRLGFDEKVDISTLEVFFKEDADSYTLPSVQPEIKLAVLSAARHLEQCGAALKQTGFPQTKDVLVLCAKSIYNLKDIPSPMQTVNNSGEVEFLKSLFGLSKYTPHVLLATVIQKKVFDWLVTDRSSDFVNLKKAITEKLGSNGVLLYPTAPSSAFKHYEGFFYVTAATYNILANGFGLPATNVPCGFDSKGMPFGIQVIAGPYQDKLCLAVAEELEKYFGGWQPNYSL